MSATQKFDPEKVWLGITPTSWWNDDFLSIDIGIPFEQCVGEMAFAGFSGCSVGHKYPTDTDVLKAALDLRGLRVSEPWVSTYFTNNGMRDQTLTAFHQQLAFIKAMGGTDMVVAEFGGAVNPLPVAIFANPRSSAMRNGRRSSRACRSSATSQTPPACGSAITHTWAQA